MEEKDTLVVTGAVLSTVMLMLPWTVSLASETVNLSIWFPSLKVVALNVLKLTSWEVFVFVIVLVSRGVPSLSTNSLHVSASPSASVTEIVGIKVFFVPPKKLPDEGDLISN